MIVHHAAKDRFHTRFDWLESWHGFSFAEHFDPDRMGHGPLRVVNEDWIAPRSGFPTHGHRNMEILTYMLAGTLTHQDSEGNRVEIRPGRVQRMHAGRGIQHSEMNLDADEPVHLLQIWIEPDQPGGPPGHDEIDVDLSAGRPVVLASRGGEAGGLELRADATVSALRLGCDAPQSWSVGAGRRGWVQVARGAGRAGGVPFGAGDAFAIAGPEHVELETDAETELVLFDLP